LSNRWEPKGGPEEFRERALEKRGRGKTWRAIAREEGINHCTLYEWFKTHPEIQAYIKQHEKNEIKDNIRQTLLEVSLTKKNIVGLIFLSKAVCKMYDTPKAPSEESDKPKEELHTAMTRAQWMELHQARQAKLKGSE
jgi:hypothetical protein